MEERVAYVSFGWIGENREVKVSLKNGVWVTTHYVDGQPDPQLIKAFGTHELPTPWSEDTDRSTVVSELEVRNSHAKII